MPSSKLPGAYVRLARSSEYADVARVLTRAFAKDPAMNWYGCVTELVDDVNSPSPKAKRTMRNLNWFQEAMVKATVLVGGIVTVVAIPRSDSEDDSGKNDPKQESQSKSAETAKEEIVATSLWLPPGKTLDMGPMTVIRSGIMKVLMGWGIEGVKVRPYVFGRVETRYSDTHH